MSTLPTWAAYVRFTDETAAYPGVEVRGAIPPYPHDGLVSELGEIFGVRARMYRDDLGVWRDERLCDLRLEIGDALWMLARISIHEQWGKGAAGAVRAMWNGGGDDDEALEHAMREAVADEPCFLTVLLYLADFAAAHAMTLEECAAENMAKLRDRKARGVIQGKGDKR